MIDLIGRPYQLGADGSDGPIDCIHLVYTVLERLGIPVPIFNPDWYGASHITIARELLAWGYRIKQPSYDGDVALLLQDSAVFAVTWQKGLLYINRDLQRVAWCPIGAGLRCHCFRMRGS